MFDVIISGAGPAGSIAGEICAKNGLKTLILEKNKLKPRFEKPCGGGIPKIIVDEFKIPHSVLANKIIGHYFYAPNGKECKLIPENNFWGYTVKRSIFDSYLTNRAIDAGIQIKEKTRVRNIIKRNGQVIGVEVKENGNIKDYFSNIIIAADGVGSQIAKNSGLREKWHNDDLAYCAVGFVEGFKNENPEYQNNFHIYVSNDIAPNCYAWLFPLNNGVVNVGTARFKHGFENPMKYLEKLLNWSKINDKFSYKKIIWKSNYPVPYNGIKGKTFGNGILIVGDAAGFVSPYSGEGIYFAMYTGKFAAETSILAHEKNDFTKKTLKNYKKLYRKSNFTSIFATHKTFRNSLITDIEKKYNILIDLLLENQNFRQVFLDSLLSEDKEGSDEIITRSFEVFEQKTVKEKFIKIMH
ncbi:MAG: NAD(P)/FAD-dependent oxidoreductase [Candidatus Helarchaeota archaeon]